MHSPRITIATVGSLGDLHPFIAIGRALAARGAAPVMAVPLDHVDKCRNAGLEAEAMLGSFADLARDTGLDDAEVVRRVLRDQDFLVRRLLLPPLTDSADRLARIAAGSQAMVGSLFALAAPIAAERARIPFVSAVLQPMAWLSPEDPGTGPNFRLFARPPLGSIGRGWNRAVARLMAAELRRRYAPAINAVRAAQGLAATRRTPLLEAGTAPALSLGLYSPALAPLPADAPAPARLTGFPWFDSDDGAAPVLPPDIAAFLAAGPPPLVVSLGSFVPYAEQNLYRRAAEAARALGLRAILLTGEPLGIEGADLLVSRYAPHSLLFPHAAAIVHHGGVGTTGQALRSGRPQLIVPFMGDQYDHGARITRLGVGLTTLPGRFAKGGAALIERLLEEPTFATRAAAVAAAMAEEDGASAAAEAILGVVGAAARK
ncbi:nucleotide disphospho-sugar-binding domain-containing protein [Sphingomonas sp. CJ20]